MAASLKCRSAGRFEPRPGLGCPAGKTFERSTQLTRHIRLRAADASMGSLVLSTSLQMVVLKTLHVVKAVTISALGSSRHVQVSLFPRAVPALPAGLTCPHLRSRDRSFALSAAPDSPAAVCTRSCLPARTPLAL